MRESLLGPCSLLMVARARTFTHTAHSRTDDTRGSGGRHAQGHRPRTQTDRRRSRAECDRMRQLPVSQKTNAVSVPSPPPLQPVTENFCTPWIELRETKCLDHPSEIVLFQKTFAASFCRATRWSPVMRELPLAPPLRSWGIAHSLAAETPPAPQCTSQAPHRL